MSNERGFSFLEIMIVISIVAIILIVAIPRYHSYAEREGLRNEANLLVSYIQRAGEEARKMGISRNFAAYNPRFPRSIVVFDTNGNVIFSHQVPSNLAFGFNPPPAQGFPCKGAALLQLPGNAAIAFNARGTLNQPLSVAISMSDSGGENFTITFQGSTGMATLGALAPPPPPAGGAGAPQCYQ